MAAADKGRVPRLRPSRLALYSLMRLAVISPSSVWGAKLRLEAAFARYFQVKARKRSLAEDQKTAKHLKRTTR